MIIIIWTVTKSYRNVIGHIEFQITNTLCCAPIFSCIMTKISTFSIIYAFRDFFNVIFPQVYHAFASWCDFNFFVVNGNIFNLSKSIIFFACSLKDLQNFFMLSLLQYKLCFFSIWSNSQMMTLNICKEYVFLFLLLTIFLDYFYSCLFFN